MLVRRASMFMRTAYHTIAGIDDRCYKTRDKSDNCRVLNAVPEISR